MALQNENLAVEFYLVGKKGHDVLIEFVRQNGIETIAFVIAARDRGVQNDYFDQIKAFCLNQKVSFFERNNDSPPVRKNNCHYGFAIGWRWLIDSSVDLIVFHDSPLPKYRGFAPLVSMLMNGESMIGVTALMADKEYDKGDIVAQELVKIEYPIKICKAIDRLIPLYIKLVDDIYKLLKQGTLRGRKQKEELATYSLWRDGEDYFIDWHNDAGYIARFCDSVGYPYKGAMTYINGESYRVLDVEIHPDVVVESRVNNIGKIIFMQDGCPVVVCRSGLLKILNFRQEGASDVNKTLPFRSRFT